MDQTILVKRNFYFDSFSLMKISAELKKEPGILEVMVCMGTDLNKAFLMNVDFAGPEVDGATVNDMIIAVRGQDREATSEGMKKAEEFLYRKEKVRIGTSRPRSLETALRRFPDANLVLFSIPGSYVKREAMTALRKGLHVMIFSDNVPLEDEVELKTIGQGEGLLVMGPDCGTAIVNGTALGFANAVQRGSVGIIGASGTGIQEVSVVLDKAGGGISHAIGTGGRDLSRAVGGITTKMAVTALALDPKTEVIILLAKAFDKTVVSEVLDLLKTSGKPSIVHLIGATPDLVETLGFETGLTLEDTALKALRHLPGVIQKEFLPSQNELDRIIDTEARELSSSQKYIRGLFSGGSLAAEMVVIFSQTVGKIHSNVSSRLAEPLPDLRKSLEHTAIDLGNDFFTRGRAHPMIDPRIRFDRILQESEDPETAIILLDIMLGYGSHPDMAGSLVPAITKAKNQCRNRGRHLSVVVTLCGTENDSQNFLKQEAKLKQAGAVVVPTNALASRVACQILIRQKRG